MPSLLLKCFSGIAVLCTVTIAAFSQSDSLALASGVTVPSGTVALNLNLTASIGSQPASLQWTLTYPTAAVTAISARAGSAATAAGKYVACAIGSAGTYKCALTGLNTVKIQSGVAAVVNITVASGVSSAAIGVTNALGASTTAGAIQTSATGGTVMVSTFTLSCMPKTIVPGATATCTILLSQAAPSGGKVFSLSSSGAAVAVPSSVTAPAGSTSVTFTATGGAVTQSQSATITATTGGTSQQFLLTVVPKIAISSLGCNPTSLNSLASSTCTVTLNSTAYSGGVSVQLSTSKKVVTVPASVNVPAGSQSATFTAQAGKFTSTQTVTLKASVPGSSLTTDLSLSTSAATSVVLTSIVCDQAALVGGTGTACSVQLTNPAPAGGTAVGLSTSLPALLIPGSVQVPEGERAAAFNLRTRPSDHDDIGTIVASTAANATDARVKVSALKPASLTCAAQSSRPEILTCEVHLNARIPQAVTLAVSGVGVLLPQVIATRPQQSSLTFEADVTPRTEARSVSIRVSYGNRFAETSVLAAPSVPSTPPVSVTIADQESNRPTVTALVNAASQSEPACSPGSLASVLGSSLSASPVMVNGSPAQVVATSPSRISFVCPDLAPGTPLQVWLADQRLWTTKFESTMQSIAPGIFTLDRSTQGVILLDGGVAGVRSYRSTGQPAQPGDVVWIRTTGIRVESPLMVSLDGIEVPVDSAEPVVEYPGVSDLRITIPIGVPVGDAVPVRVRVPAAGAWTESNTVTMAIELPRP